MSWSRGLSAYRQVFFEENARAPKNSHSRSQSSLRRTESGVLIAAFSSLINPAAGNLASSYTTQWVTGDVFN